MSLSPNDLDLDMSELEGRALTCDPSCGLCCLCQPEILPHEVEWFRSNHPRRIVTLDQPHRHVAVALKNGQGPCSFLNSTRRCEIYPHRPHHCRQFPLHLYVGKRVQAELDLSCRGVWYGGTEDVLVEGGKLVQDNLDTLRHTLMESRAIYQEFEANCREVGIYRPDASLRQEVEQRVERFSELPYLAHVLDLSGEDDEMTLPNGSCPRYDMNELERSAMETGMESLDAEDAFSAPIYCDPKGRWNLFLVRDDLIKWAILNDDGGLTTLGDIDPSKVKLLVPEGEGKGIFWSYLRTLNRRDSVMGYAYFLADYYGYEDFLANTYYGVIATSALDLLWRSSLIAYLCGGKLDRAGMIEGIISYDMDRLDAPTIGAFI